MRINAVQGTIIVAIIGAIAMIIAAMIEKEPGPAPPPCDIMKELLVEGDNLLELEDIPQKSFETWRNKCEGVLKESFPDIKDELLKIEENHLTFDFYSQTTAINRLLESKIAKCK